MVTEGLLASAKSMAGMPRSYAEQSIFVDVDPKQIDVPRMPIVPLHQSGANHAWSINPQRSMVIDVSRNY